DLLEFMDSHVYPAERVWQDQVEESGDPYFHPPVMEELKAEAQDRGLWNLFLPDERFGAGLTNLEYAPLAEIMGGTIARAPHATNWPPPRIRAACGPPGAHHRPRPQGDELRRARHGKHGGAVGVRLAGPAA